MTDFAIRRLRSGDTLDGLTRLLHRAFQDLARQGIECQCATQSVATTRERAARGECFIAVTGAEIIGTITLEPPHRACAIASYRDPATASVHQLAVDPARQGEGVGRSLMSYAAAWARARRYQRLALDTPEGASKQVAWYFDRGFDIVEHARVPGRGYGSVVMAKLLATDSCQLARRITAPARTPARGFSR
jgi:GNAT superfamily N-acetyltransferase